ncbi:MAG: arylsulfotransferase family protein, partial [Bacteroidales bacterium]
YTLGGTKVFYNDYRITKFDNETGEILFDKSITEILKENNLVNYLFKSATTKEPIHLNDVQPALKTTEFYQEDDVFISLRNFSAILHYRPSTNELIDLLEGPFANQHDVDFLNDSTLVIFNNNTYVDISRRGLEPHGRTDRIVNAGDFYSNIVSYNFKTDSFSFIGDSIFRANKIFTVNEGLMEFIDPETYFVEEQNSGLLWVIRDDEVIYKNVLKSQHEGHHHLPNWTRIVKYGPDEFQN